MCKWLVSISCHRDKEGLKSVQEFSNTKVFDVIAENISREMKAKATLQKFEDEWEVWKWSQE